MRPKCIFKTVTATINQNFIIVMPPKPVTGHKWYVKYDPEMMDLVKRYHNVLNELPGGENSEEFTFLPKKKGRTKIFVYYKRPWEEKKTDHMTVIVKIKKGKKP